MTKLTPETQQKLIQLLKLGTPQKYAAEASGIDEATFYQWIKLGRNKKEGKYYEFAESIKRANSEAMAIKLADLEKAAQKGNVSAITWFLEHRYPDVFGNKLQVEYTGKITFNQFRELFKRDEVKSDVRDVSVKGGVITPKIIQLPTSDNK
jgi:hypothetical protein